MKHKEQLDSDTVFSSPFTLDVAVARLKNVTRRGVYLRVERLDTERVAFQLSARYGIGIVAGQMSRDGNQTLVTYTAKWRLRGVLSFAVGQAYPIILFTLGIPLAVAFGIQALVYQQMLEAVLLLVGVLMMTGWLVSAWRVAFKQQQAIAQVLFYALRDPIPDIPDLSRS